MQIWQVDTGMGRHQWDLGVEEAEDNRKAVSIYLELLAIQRWCALHILTAENPVMALDHRLQHRPHMYQNVNPAPIPTNLSSDTIPNRQLDHDGYSASLRDMEIVLCDFCLRSCQCLYVRQKFKEH